MQFMALDVPLCILTYTLLHVAYFSLIYSHLYVYVHVYHY